MSDTTQILERILSSLPAAPAPDGPPCPGLARGEHCDREGHYLGDPTEPPGRDPSGRPLPRAPFVRPCPEAQALRIRRRLREERQRLGGLLGRCAGGFAAYQPDRAQGGAQALEAMRDFAAARPPARNVLLAGPLGTGKTHLLLSAHLELLGAGVRSYFVSSTDLRALFMGCASWEAARQEEAFGERDELERAQAILWDDAGDVEGDERGRGAFAEGLKYLLDRSRAAWAVSTNLTYDEARRHPDVGAKVISRLLDGGTVVRMSGADQRLRRRP